MIKNAMFFSMSEKVNTDVLNKALSKQQYSGIGSQQAEAFGFVPFAEGMDLLYSVSGVRVGAVRFDKKSLPSSAVKQRVKERAKDLEAQQGFTPGRKQLRELKDEVVNSFLSRIPASSKVVNFFLWDDLLVIDTSSAKTADTVISLLVKCMDRFPVTVIQTEYSPAERMTYWLTSGEIPSAFTIDNEVDMKTADDSKASVRWKNETVNENDACEHQQRGKRVVKMAMTWADKISFVFNEKFVVGRIKAQDILVAKVDEESDAADTDANIAIFAGELYSLLKDLITACGKEAE